MRKRPSFRFWLYVVLTIAVLSLFPIYSNFRQAAAPVPPGVHLAGMDLSAYKDPVEIIAHMEPIFREPIVMRFQERSLLLEPAEIDFIPDFAQTIADAGQYLEGLDFVDISLREAVGLPQQYRNVPLRYTYDETKLQRWLETAAASLDYPSVDARVRAPESTTALAVATAVVTATDTVTTPVATAPTPPPIRELEWVEGVPGYRIDVDTSVRRTLDTLAAYDRRIGDLALEEIPPSPPAMADLEQELQRALDTFPVFSTVYIHDLQHDEEANVDGDAAFSGMATLKLALAVALMAELPAGVAADDAEARQVGQWIDLAIGQGSDAAADEALAWLGDGDVATGARRLTAFMQQMGMVNSYIQAGFGATTQLPALATPSNQREKPNTRPDTNMQTTPEDIGRLLSAVYACSQDSGPLRDQFPTAVSSEECSTVLFYLAHNELRDAVWRGLPDWNDRWIVHQHGLSPAQHGDVALIWGPTGPYVLSVFFYNPGLTDAETANRSMMDLSRMIWDFFEFQRAQGGPVAGDPPVLQPPPGYEVVARYARSAANPDRQ